MLALIALAAVLASPPPEHPAAAAAASPLQLYLAKEREWVASNLDTAGWKLGTMGTDILVFLRPLPHTGPDTSTGGAMIAVRGEHYPFAQTNPIGSGESFLSRDEIDCTKTLERTVSSTVYSDNGLRGNIVSASDDPSPWTAIKDGTFMATALKALCPGPSSAAKSR